MADTRFYLTSCVAERYACLEIKCGRCGHKVIADAPKIVAMFPKPMALDKVHYRLVCKACGKRWPTVNVIRKPER